MRKTTSLFVEDAQKVHGDRFDYSEVEYVNTHKPVRIKCRQCGVVFMQEPAHDSPRKMVMQTTCKDKDLFANIGFMPLFYCFSSFREHRHYGKFHPEALLERLEKQA